MAGKIEQVLIFLIKLLLQFLVAIFNLLNPYLSEMRIIKDASEVKNMQTAADLASKAHMKAMVKTQPGLYEYNIAAEFDSVFKNENSEHSYPPIVCRRRKCLHTSLQ